MLIGWKERLERQPSLRDYRCWGYVDRDIIPSAYQGAYLRNERMVLAALDGIKLKKIARDNNVSLSYAGQLLKRCLGGDDAETPPLSAGLIPHHRLRVSRRRAPLSTFENMRGSRCEFSDLLRQLPRLRSAIDDVIRARMNDDVNAQAKIVVAVRDEFKRFLEDSNWPRDTYPYTRKTFAKHGLQRYTKRRINEIRAEKTRQILLASPTAQLRALRFRVLDVLEIDEQLEDLHQSIHLVLNDEMIPLRIARVSVVVAICPASDCVFGYSLVATRHPNQDDMLGLFEQLQKKWYPEKLSTPGLAYGPGDEFPSSPQFPPSNILLDNALAHLANSVSDAVGRRMGSALCFSGPGKPKARRWAEAAMKLLNDNVTHRHAATTGSHPKDPIRESKKNAKSIPIVTYTMLNEAISVVLARHNNTSQNRLGSATPLEMVKHHQRTQLLGYCPQSLQNDLQFFVSSQPASLKWNRKEKRNPHINFYGVRYQGPGLLAQAPYDERITVKFDRRDIRVLHAFSPAGKDLGKLYAPLSWQRFPHSLATRRVINDLVMTKEEQRVGPLAAYFKRMLEDRNTPSGALKLLRVYTEFTHDGRDHIDLRDSRYATASNEQYRYGDEENAAKRGETTGSVSNIAWSADKAWQKVS
jgi:putative transposase